MRLISIFISFAAALITVLLAFGCYKEQVALDNNGGMEDTRQRIEQYRREIETLEAQLKALENQKQEAADRLALLQSKENYKTEPTTFLTFDGGFTANTVEIVKILDKYELKGTFFIIGETLENSKTMREALKSAAESGHKIGIRSYKNSVSTMYKDEEAYFEDLYACRDLIKEITGQDAVLVRMPGGTGTADIRFKKNTGSDETLQKVLTRLEAEGFMVNDWTVNSQDTDSDLSAEDVVTNTLYYSKKYLTTTYKTNLILFTDTKKTDSSLPGIIDGLKTQGYSFSGLPTAITITRQR